MRDLAHAERPRDSHAHASLTLPARQAMAKAEAGAAADVDDDDYVETMKPGQKEPTPSPGNADRVFYETLLEQARASMRPRVVDARRGADSAGVSRRARARASQIPSSHMAKEYCLRFGILTFDRALKVYKELYGEAYKEGSKRACACCSDVGTPCPAAARAQRRARRPGLSLSRRAQRGHPRPSQSPRQRRQLRRRRRPRPRSRPARSERPRTTTMAEIQVSGRSAATSATELTNSSPPCPPHAPGRLAQDSRQARTGKGRGRQAFSEETPSRLSNQDMTPNHCKNSPTGGVEPQLEACLCYERRKKDVQPARSTGHPERGSTERHHLVRARGRRRRRPGRSGSTRARTRRRARRRRSRFRRGSAGPGGARPR